MQKFVAVKYKNKYILLHVLATSSLMQDSYVIMPCSRSLKKLFSLFFQHIHSLKLGSQRATLTCASIKTLVCVDPSNNTASVSLKLRSQHKNLMM